MDFWALFGWRSAQVLGFTLAVVGLMLVIAEISSVDPKKIHAGKMMVGFFFIILGLALGIAITEHLP